MSLLRHFRTKLKGSLLNVKMVKTHNQGDLWGLSK